MQRPADQQPRHLVGRAAAVQQDRVAVFDQLDRLVGDRPLLLPAGGLPGVEMGQLRRTAGIKHPAVDPPRNAVLFQLLQIPPDRRLGNIQVPRPTRASRQTAARGPTPSSDFDVLWPAWDRFRDRCDTIQFTDYHHKREIKQPVDAVS